MSLVDKLTEKQKAALHRALTLKEKANVEFRSEHSSHAQSSCIECLSRLYVWSERGLCAGQKLVVAFELYTSASDILESVIFTDVRDTDADVKAALAVVKGNLAAVCLSVQSYGDVIQAGLLLSVFANL